MLVSVDRAASLTGHARANKRSDIHYTRLRVTVTVHLPCRASGIVRGPPVQYDQAIMARDACDMLHLEADDAGGTRIDIKVVPGASRDRVVGLLGSRLKVTVSRPPEKGAANKAVAQLLAKALGVRPREVELVAGATRPEKTFRIAGLSPDDLRRRLADT